MTTTAETGAEAPKTESAVEEPQSAISSVQSQMDVLTDLSKRLQALRQIPSSLLRSENPSGRNPVIHVEFSTPLLKDTFRKSVEELRTVHATAMEEKVQEALQAAAESERRDGTEIRDTREKQSQKRRCVRPLSALFFWGGAILLNTHVLNVTVARPLLSPRDHICPCSIRPQAPFPRLQHVRCRLHSRNCLHTSESSIPHIRRKCCCIFTWRLGSSHAALPYLSCFDSLSLTY